MKYLQQQIVEIRNKTGIHARSASTLVQKANSFYSEISLVYEGKEADAKSILAVMSLGIDYGREVVVKAEGEDEEFAIKTLTEFINDLEDGE
ncbi:MAG: HPr family phosphocarrier protein [Firmicutes bacterium]|nr:HPr family phosphocarrier protein [Bacillota bacterium]